MSDDAQKDADLELVRKACEALSEHFDSVQIFTTRHESGELDGTVNINWGSGNFFTRYGQIKLWCARNDEESREDERRRPREN